uniref:Uncharacterized protein n=1 Tax=Siphoviridae sp. ctvyM23 TaxID=2826514 RepID=A0A8S5MHP0_9CAUD|nr:MAG TPA: hypothetical protein [Siphoviridae sp. ctvyM23]
MKINLLAKFVKLFYIVRVTENHVRSTANDLCDK